MSEHVNCIVFCLDCQQVFNLGEHTECVPVAERTVGDMLPLDFGDD